jgi:putative tricarboxylic transport membrane protein
VLLAIAFGYGAAALRIPGQDGEPGPGFLPLGLAVLLAGLSVWIIWSGLRSAEPAGVETPDGGPRSTSGPCLAGLATVLYVALFQPLGFVLSTLAYSGAVTSLFTRDGKLRFIVPALVTLALYLFFRVALGVRLPVGMLG